MKQSNRLVEQTHMKKVNFTFNDQKLEGYEGEVIAAAIIANGIIAFRTCSKTNEKRGVYCGIGHCFECRAIVNGTANVRTCVTPLKEGTEIISMNY